MLVHSMVRLFRRTSLSTQIDNYLSSAALVLPINIVEVDILRYSVTTSCPLSNRTFCAMGFRPIFRFRPDVTEAPKLGWHFLRSCSWRRQHTFVSLSLPSVALHTPSLPLLSCGAMSMVSSQAMLSTCNGRLAFNTLNHVISFARFCSSANA
jgi:hypothetical protein